LIEVATVAAELTELKNFLYDTLAGDATLQGYLGGAANPRVYADQIPQTVLDSGSVALFFRTQSPGTDANGVGTVRLAAEPLMYVAAVRKGQPNATQKAVDARADALLKDVRASASGAHLISLQREMPVDRAYFDTANNRFHDLGGLWRAYVRA
jgi:hypothetical protein